LGYFALMMMKAITGLCAGHLAQFTGHLRLGQERQNHHGKEGVAGSSPALGLALQSRFYPAGGLVATGHGSVLEACIADARGISATRPDVR